MRKIDSQQCQNCCHPLVFGQEMQPPDAQVWRCAKCGHRNYVPGGADCDCPIKGFGQGCACRVAQFPMLKYASDEWCNCKCHQKVIQG